MNIWTMIVDAIGIIFELYIVFTYFKVVFGEQFVSKRVKILFYILCVIMSFVASILFKNSNIYLFAVNLLLYIIISFSYKSTITAKIFSSILLYVFFLASEIICGITLANIIGATVKSAQTHFVYYLQGVLVSRFGVFILVKIMSMNKKAKTVHANLKVSILLTLFSLASVMAICTIAFFAYDTIKLEAMVLSSFSIIALVCSNVAIFYVFEKQSEIDQTKERLKSIQNQLQSQIEHYKELYSTQQETRRIWHDMKNSLMAVSGYLSAGENTQAINYIDELCGIVSKAIHVVDTGCPAIDAILKTKLQKAETAKIKLRYRVALPEIIKVDTLDLAVLVANGLDNAIEAVEGVKEEKKAITLHIMTKQDYIFIVITNPTKTKLDINELKTTKHDKLSHGFGLENIRAIANKYFGDVNIEHSDLTFTLSVLLKNRQSTTL